MYLSTYKKDGSVWKWCRISTYKIHLHLSYSIIQALNNIDIIFMEKNAAYF